MASTQLIQTIKKEGDIFTLYQLQSTSGASVAICNWGFALQSVRVADRNGKLGEVVIGYDDPTLYKENPVFFGAIVGRYANRIADARFKLDGKTHQLPANNGPNNLHGGPKGFGHLPWEILDHGTMGNTAYLTGKLVSPDGNNGFPGKLEVLCTYKWSDNQQLTIEYAAHCDAPTVVNLTNHSYFNLAGKGNILEHELQLAAAHYTPLNAQQIPTGAITAVTGTPFDFSQAKALGKDLAAAGGYDHNFVVDGQPGTLRPVGSLFDPASGRRLHCATTQPGVQLFTANFDEGQFAHRNGQPLVRHGGVCLETQSFPNAPNQPSFPSAVLRLGEVYQETVTYHFGVA